MSYTAIILAGGALLVVIFYYLFSELFSRETPTGIYDESSVICTRDPGVIILNQKKNIKKILNLTLHNKGDRRFGRADKSNC